MSSLIMLSKPNKMILNCTGMSTTYPPISCSTPLMVSGMTVYPTVLTSCPVSVPMLMFRSLKIHAPGLNSLIACLVISVTSAPQSKVTVSCLPRMAAGISLVHCVPSGEMYCHIWTAFAYQMSFYVPFSSSATAVLIVTMSFAGLGSTQLTWMIVWSPAIKVSADDSPASQNSEDHSPVIQTLHGSC